MLLWIEILMTTSIRLTEKKQTPVVLSKKNLRSEQPPHHNLMHSRADMNICILKKDCNIWMERQRCVLSARATQQALRERILLGPNDKKKLFRHLKIKSFLLEHF